MDKKLNNLTYVEIKNDEYEQIWEVQVQDYCLGKVARSKMRNVKRYYYYPADLQYHFGPYKNKEEAANAMVANIQERVQNMMATISLVTYDE